jgi:hypothetical protein
MLKIRNTDELRLLQDVELDLANGGVLDCGVTKLPVLTGGTTTSSDWTFVDQFAKYTIGRYTRM